MKRRSKAKCTCVEIVPRSNRKASLSSMLESFAALSGDFPACWNPSPRRRETFQHAGILRRVVGKLSSMLESFTALSGNFPARWNPLPRRREGG